MLLGVEHYLDFGVSMRRPKHHVRGRSIVTMLIVVCMTATLGACGPSKNAAARILLLPYPAEHDRVWEWTAACRFGPRTSTGCAAAGPDLGVAQLAGNAWNLGGGPGTTGSVRMSVNASGGVEMKGNLSSAPPCTDPTCIAPEGDTWVRGYPSVLYGIDQCNAKTSPRQSRELRLPMRVRSIPSDLIGSATYDAQMARVTYDVAYDLWLNPSDTKTPCKTDGTLEVMVWTDYDARSLLPDGLKVGTATVPFAVNGDANPGKQAWSVYVGGVHERGHTVPWGGTVWLVLDAEHRVRKGAVTVDLSSALTAVGALLRNNYRWSNFASNYWLDTITFGAEFGPENGDPYGAGPTDFSLNIESYCVELRTTVSAAAC